MLISPVVSSDALEDYTKSSFWLTLRVKANRVNQRANSVSSNSSSWSFSPKSKDKGYIGLKIRFESLEGLFSARTFVATLKLTTGSDREIFANKIRHWQPSERVWKVSPTERPPDIQKRQTQQSHTVDEVEKFSRPGYEANHPRSYRTTKFLLKRGQAEQTLEGHSDSVTSVVFSPDGSKVASGSGDGTVRVWNVATGQAEQSLEGHSDWVTSFVFSPDGSKVASGSSDRTVRVWNIATGQAEQTLEGHSDWVTSVVFSPDGSKVASGSGDRTVRMWNVATGQAEQTLKGHSSSVTSVVFSPDGSKVASGSGDGTVRVWNVATGQAEQTLEGHSDWVGSVVFSPDGSKVASGSSDRTVRVWNVATGQAEQTLEGHSDWVRSVVFSPDGSKVASGSSDRTVRVWNVATGQAEQTLEGHSDWVTSVVFSPDGSKVASGSDDRTVQVWNVATGANPNASRIDRDLLLEVAEGGDKNCFVLLLAYGADMSKTEAFCHEGLPSEIKSNIQAWLKPWRAHDSIESLPNLGTMLEDLESDARNLISQTVAMDWELPLVVERIKRLNPEKSAYDCLWDEVVLIGYEKGPLGECRRTFEATTCGEFTERRWPHLGKMLVADIAARCSLELSHNETGQ